MQSRWVSIVGIVLAVGLVVVAVVVTLGTATAGPKTLAQVRPLACALCDHQYTGEIADRPGKCPGCGKNGVWPAGKCARCGTITAVDMVRFNAEQRDPYCKKCASRQLVEVTDDQSKKPGTR